MFKPAKPHAEKKPLTNIMKPPKKPPRNEPNTKPTVKVKREVNSTFGGLGDNCTAKHKAPKTLMTAIIMGLFVICIALDGLSNHISLSEQNRSSSQNIGENS
jgi:hypothetical protein